VKQSGRGGEQARVTMAIPADVWKRAKHAAIERDMKYQELVTVALERYLDMLDRAAARAQERRKGSGRARVQGRSRARLRGGFWASGRLGGGRRYSRMKKAAHRPEKAIKVIQ
jgi:hypothetical protein